MSLRSGYHSVWLKHEDELIRCVHWDAEPTYTVTTFDMTAATPLQVDRSSRTNHGSHVERWHRRGRSSSTRIHRHWGLRSFQMTSGRCRGHMWWTSCRLSNSMHHYQRYPSSQTLVACSCSPHWIQGMNCTGRDTSWKDWHAIAGQTWACSGQFASVDWAGRCRAKSCLPCRWIRL